MDDTPPKTVTDEELEAVALRVRAIRRRNLLARLVGTAIGMVALIAGVVTFKLIGVKLIAGLVAGVGVFLGGAAWMALESKVHVDDL